MPILRTSMYFSSVANYCGSDLGGRVVSTAWLAAMITNLWDMYES